MVGCIQETLASWRGWLLPDCRTGERYDHSRRRKHLPAGDRGVSLRLSGNQRSPDRRHPQRKVWRRGGRVGEVAGWRKPFRRRNSGILQRKDRVVQDSALYQDRERISHDGHWEDPEIPHEGNSDPGTGFAGVRPHRNSLAMCITAYWG